MRQTLESFRDDHERHASVASRPRGRRTRSASSCRAFTAIQARAGDQASLLATRENEKLTNQAYREALRSKDLPEDVLDLVRRNYADERRHLAWVEQQIAALAPA